MLRLLQTFNSDERLGDLWVYFNQLHEVEDIDNISIIFLFLSDLIGMGNSDPLPLQGRDILIYLIHSFDIHLFIYSCVCFLGFVSDLSYQKRNKDG